ncbi:MAG: hypothetical protein ACOC2H_02555 [Spirochaetota bacterium]
MVRMGILLLMLALSLCTQQLAASLLELNRWTLTDSDGTTRSVNLKTDDPLTYRRGYLQYETEDRLPSSLRNGTDVFYAGMVDDSDTLLVNGIPAGHRGRIPPSLDEATGYAFSSALLVNDVPRLAVLGILLFLFCVQTCKLIRLKERRLLSLAGYVARSLQPFIWAEEGKTEPHTIVFYKQLTLLYIICITALYILSEVSFKYMVYPDEFFWFRAPAFAFLSGFSVFLTMNFCELFGIVNKANGWKRTAFYALFAVTHPVLFIPGTCVCPDITPVEGVECRCQSAALLDDFAFARLFHCFSRHPHTNAESAQILCGQPHRQD